MKTNYSILKKCILFKNISENDYNTILNCLNSYIKSYSKGEFIFNTNNDIKKIGILLSGNIQIIKEDFFGTRDILTNISSGEIFGESFIASNMKTPLVSILAKENSTILFIDYPQLINTCRNSCEFHNKLIENMLNILAIKNVTLTQKIEHMSKKTIKDKLLSYLSSQAIYHNTNSFDIPFNRQELADYLCVDRSAMSNELCKLRDSGVISFYKNHFTVHISEI